MTCARDSNPVPNECSRLSIAQAFGLDEAGVAGFENSATESCANFFAGTCPLFLDLFEELVSIDDPPSPPPPPLPPIFNMILRQPTRIFFSGGVSADTAAGRRLTEEDVEVLDMDDSDDVIEACTDAGCDTLCEANGYENSWIMYDLGDSYEISAVRIFSYPHGFSPPAPTYPPPPSPSPPPPTPSPPPPLPPISPIAKPPPAGPLCNAEKAEFFALSTCYYQGISRTFNGFCEDGQDGSVAGFCESGTD